MASLKRVWIPSPNYSSRSGATVRLIVCHTAEGARTIESLGGFFQGDVGASSHTGADDKVNTIGEYVSRNNKAWTQANYNPSCVSIELCGFASWSRDEWMNNHHNMLVNCALWIAEEAAAYGLPIVKLSAGEAQGSGRGVCQHVDLGSGGGGHWDCGSGFPMDYVLDIARGGGGVTQPEAESNDMIASALSDGDTLHVWWVGEDRQTVSYRYQRKNDHEWQDGGVFTKAPKKVAGLSATLAANGTLELFAVYDDGTPAHTWQKAKETKWAGGEEGKGIANFSNLPK